MNYDRTITLKWIFKIEAGVIVRQIVRMNCLAITFVHLAVIVNLRLCYAGRRIVNGTEISIKDASYQVSVLLKGNPNCGGSLISHRFVLSAAHCRF